MKKSRPPVTILIIIAFAFMVCIPSLAVSEVRGAFLYNLSDFTGTIPYNWARVFIDRERNESYVLYQNFFRVFNENGMEIYRFGDDIDLGHIVDAAVDGDGNILMLSYKMSEYSITRANFRGEPIGRIEIKNLPPEFSKFLPNRMIYQAGNLYFASLGGLRAVVTDSDGNFKYGFDMVAVLQLEEKERADNEMVGFSVDREGNILFTIPVLFKAFKLSPDKKLTSFGRPGGAPGRFGVIAGIVTDKMGNYLVVDKLKCVVSVFDRETNFLTEFGYRGFMPGNLIAPDDIAIDDKGKIYVTQSRNRGVSVFQLTYQ